MVVILKRSGEIRVYVDMRCANEAVLRERHPIPTLEEILHDMFVWFFRGESPGCRLFGTVSMLDWLRNLLPHH